MSELEIYLKVDNRRQNERLPSQPGIRLTVGGKPAKIINISSTGIRFVVSKKLEGDEIQLVISLGPNQQQLVARKVWSEEVGPCHHIVGVSIVKAFQRTRLAVAC